MAGEVYSQAQSAAQVAAIELTPLKGTGTSPMRSPEAAFPYITPEQMKLWEERPMNVILSEMGDINSQAYQTAAHEANHAFCSPSDVVEISVVPNGNILGYTMFNRIPDAATTAAGMVETFNGRARGWSGDLMQLLAQTPLLELAKHQAKDRLGIIPNPVKKLVAKAISVRGNVDGEEFRRLYAQAEWEHRWLSLFPHLSFSVVKKALPFIEEKIEPAKINFEGVPIPRSGEYILAIDTTNGVTKIYHFLDGKQIGIEVIKCRKCGAVGGGHAQICISKNKPGVVKTPIVDNTPIKKLGLAGPTEMLEPAKHDRLPHHNNIFTFGEN